MEATARGRTIGHGNGVSVDPLGPRLSAALRAAVAADASPMRGFETPVRRKSSALSILHLTTATPPVRRTTGSKESEHVPITEVATAAVVDAQALASQAVRDIARELDAVEARLSVYRRSREGISTEEHNGHAEATFHEPESTRQEASAGGGKASEASGQAPVIPAPAEPKRAVPAPTPAPSRPLQQAGEVADEVEHALANCDRLLQQAKLQASSASLTRSLGTSRGSATGPARATSMLDTEYRVDTGSRYLESNAERDGGSIRHRLARGDDLVSASPLPPQDLLPRTTKNSFLQQDEMELEATAMTMRRFANACQDEMEREATAVVTQNQQTQAAALRDMQRKFETKKKMLLLQVREQCENETKAAVKQAIAQCELEQQAAIKAVETKLLDERERLLNDILLKHHADTENHVRRVEVRVQGDTMTQKQQLEIKLNEEFEQQLRQLEQDSDRELQQWEERKRLELEREVFKQREQAATNILRAQEAKTNALKKQIHDQYSSKEKDEIEKLKKALAFGAQAQTQQLKKQLEAQHELNVKNTQLEANQALEAKMADLKQVLTMAHKQELEKTQRDLEKRHRIAVMELHEQMENVQRLQLEEIKVKADKELDQALAVVRQQLEQENRKSMEMAQQTMQRDHQVRLQQLETEHDAICSHELEQLRQRLIQAQSMEVEAKLARMRQSKAQLLDEAMMLLSPNGSTSTREQSGTPESRRLLDMQSQLPKQLQRAVTTLVRDFEDLSEEQQILVEKISESTGLYLTFKRQSGQLEAEVAELRSMVETMQQQLQAKDAMAKKLYMANEALLKRLGLDQLQAS